MAQLPQPLRSAAGLVARGATAVRAGITRLTSRYIGETEKNLEDPDRR